MAGVRGYFECLLQALRDEAAERARRPAAAHAPSLAPPPAAARAAAQTPADSSAAVAAAAEPTSAEATHATVDDGAASVPVVAAAPLSAAPGADSASAAPVTDAGAAAGVESTVAPAPAAPSQHVADVGRPAMPAGPKRLQVAITAAGASAVAAACWRSLWGDAVATAADVLRVGVPLLSVLVLGMLVRDATPATGLATEAGAAAPRQRRLVANEQIPAFVALSVVVLANGAAAAPALSKPVLLASLALFACAGLGMLASDNGTCLACAQPVFRPEARLTPTPRARMTNLHYPGPGLRPPATAVCAAVAALLLVANVVGGGGGLAAAPAIHLPPHPPHRLAPAAAGSALHVDL